MTALVADELEDDLWSSETLHARGMSGDCADERTPGEFTVAEMTYADTLVLTSHPMGCHQDNQRTLEMVKHIAPHLAVVDLQNGGGECGCDYLSEVQKRAVPGYLEVPANESLHDRDYTGIATAVAEASAVVDAQLLAQVLPRMVEGAVRVRGYVWLDSHLDERVAVEGIGPTVWLQTHGVWADAPATRIAVTGEGVDAREVQELLDSCLVTGERIVQHLLDESYEKERMNSEG
ncbi:GTP-binding protein [Rothia sp. ZJ932]|uniref:GTP-binding protein n=1 Tax=Rothia sp. ZJ932 TaxID=2810516 RepID=UPI00196786D0|nr:GTP-binding protein [Rothia sp. ZJ932]QRZ61369.1 cobalamin biosynthesis protein CobW [Rothia sp. ZJ932]